jgi:hypothetical protein
LDGALNYRVNQEAVSEIMDKPREESRELPEGLIMGGATFCWVAIIGSIIFMLAQIVRAVVVAIV